MDGDDDRPTTSRRRYPKETRQNKQQQVFTKDSNIIQKRSSAVNCM